MVLRGDRGQEEVRHACIDPEEQDIGWVYFEKDGAYQKWTNGKGRACLVFRYSVDKDTMIVNFGDEGETKILMMAEGIEATPLRAFKTQTGWLGTYLQKSGSGSLVPVAQDKKLGRSAK